MCEGTGKSGRPDGCPGGRPRQTFACHAGSLEQTARKQARGAALPANLQHACRRENFAGKEGVLVTGSDRAVSDENALRHKSRERDGKLGIRHFHSINPTWLKICATVVSSRGTIRGQLKLDNLARKPFVIERTF